MINEYKEKLEQANRVIDILIEVVAGNEDGPMTWEFISCDIEQDCALCTHNDRVTCWKALFEKQFDEGNNND